MSESNDNRIEAEEFLRKANELSGVDAHALAGQRRPACWRGDLKTGRHDESELHARSEHHLPPP